jgi:uncharacterized protein (DUF952 family)
LQLAVLLGAGEALAVGWLHSMMKTFIYHIVPKQLFISNITNDLYKPKSLEMDGFIHCSMESSVIPVANDYFFNELDQLLLIKLDQEKLSAEIKYECPVTPEGVSTNHKNSAPVFPHGYGPIEISAIEGIGIIKKENSKYFWPQSFISPKNFHNS